MKSYTAFRGVVRQTMGVVGDGDASEALVLARVEEDLCSGNLPDLAAIETRLRERLARLHAGSALAWYAAMGLQVLAALRSAQAHGDWQRACGLYYRLGEFEKLADAQAIFTPSSGASDAPNGSRRNEAVTAARFARTTRATGTQKPRSC